MGQGQSIAAQTLSTMLRIFLFSAPDFPLTVAVEGETILLLFSQAKTDANQTKQKTPHVIPKP